MGTQVDTRIVELKFDQEDFVKKTQDTMLKLEYLNRELDKFEATNVFGNLTKSADNVDLSGISDSIDETAREFSVLEIAAITAIANISNSLVNLGKTMLKNLVDPILKGGLTRAQNIELASFQFEGLGITHSAKDKREQVSYYSEVMDAVLGTAYSYDVAAKAASQLAASNIGVKKSTEELADGTKRETKVMTKEMTDAILGIAGVASMTGSDFQSISEIFTRVAGQGRVMANDLNSIASRGLNAAAVLAKAMGKTESEIRDMVSKGKISFKDFSDAMSEAYGTHAKDSTKMFSGALADVEAALARVGADFYGKALVAGRDVLNSLTPLIDVLHEKIQWMLDDSGKGLLYLSKRASQVFDTISYVTKSLEKASKDNPNPLESWIKSNGKSMDNVIDLYVNNTKILKKAIEDLGNGINGIKINGIKMLADYLGITGDQVETKIEDGTIGLRDFRLALEDLYAKSPKMNADTKMWDSIQTFLQGLEKEATSTEEFKNKIEIATDVIGNFQSVLESLGSILSSVAKITVSIIQPFTPILVVVAKVIDAFADLVVGLLDYIANATKIKEVTDTLTKIFSNFAKALHLDGVSKTIVGAITNLFGFIGKAVETTVGGILTVVESIFKVVDHIITKLTELTGNVDLVGKAIKDLGLVSLIAIIARIVNALIKPLDLLDTIHEYIKNFAKSFSGILDSIKTLGDNIGGVFKKIGDAIQALTNSIKADIVIKVAVAIAILSGALYLLSTIDGKKGANTLKLLAVQIGQIITLVGSVMAILTKLSKSKLGAFAIGKAGDLIKTFAESLLILSAACYILAKIDTDKLGNAVGAITVLLAELAIIAALLSSEDSLKIGWKGIEKTSNSITSGVKSLIALAGAVWILADAAKKISDIPEDRFADCIGAVAFLFGEMAVMAKLLGSNKTKGFMMAALSMVVMSTSILILTNAMLRLNELSVEELQKVGFTLGIALGALTGIALLLGKQGASFIGAAVSMLIMMGALKGLVEVFQSMKDMDLNAVAEQIALLLITFAGLALILGALGNSGGSFVLAAAAIFIMVQAIENLAEALGYINNMGALNAAKALGVIALGIVGLAAACAVFDKVPLKGILKFASTLALIAIDAALFGAAAVVIGIGFSLVAAGVNALASTAGSLEGFVAVFLTVVGMIILATGLLQAFVGPILLVSAALIAFGLSLMSIGAGLQMVATAIDILTALKDILPQTGKDLLSFTKDIAGMSKYSSKIKKAADDISTAFEKMQTSAKTTAETFEAFKDAGSKIVSNMISGMNIKEQELIDALKKLIDKVAAKQKPNVDTFKTIGENLIKGLIKGINSQMSELESAVQKLEDKAERAIEAKAKIKSPSRVWAEIGSYLTLGLAKGISGASGSVARASGELVDLSTTLLETAADKIRTLADDTFDIEPTITPVIDMRNALVSAGTIDTLLSSNRAMTVAASINSRVSSVDQVNKALSKLQDSFNNQNQNGGNTYVINGITYDDGSNVANAVGELVRDIRLERRT